MTGEARDMPVELVARWRDLGLWQDISLAEAMARGAYEHPDALLHIHSARGSSEATLAEAHAAGRRLAGALHGLGLRAGDVIAMQLPNCLENAILFQAAAAIGCVILPIVHIFGPAELGQVLGDSRAKALVMPDRWRNIDFLDRLRRLPELPHLAHRILIGEAAPPGSIAWGELVGSDPPSVDVDPNAPAILLYTSGTTAAPKGAQYSANSFIAELRARAPNEGRPPCRLSPWPSGHVAGTLGVFGHAVLGQPMVLMDAWDAEAAAELIERFAVAQSSGTPFHLAGLMEAAARDGRDLSSLEQFIIGATTVPPSVVQASEAAGIRCCRSYGSTEMPTFSQCLPDDPLDKRLNSDGRLNPGCEARIVDDAGRDLPPGSEGELAVRGAERFLGYTDPELDRSSFLPDGWFLTGDIARIDTDGFLAITDRKKDIIIRGGENISSREVEELLLRVPGVREAAAIGMPDRRMGERVCAVLLVEDGAAPTLAAIGAAFQEMGVARQKAPEKIVILPDLPRTPTGKVQKAELRRQLAQMFAAATE
ncbi:MAG: AMP-binding protein [Caulobacteraceae bacterium]|nr:AMP-binding protein [Caulobacteraceae bacterium]